MGIITELQKKSISGLNGSKDKKKVASLICATTFLLYFPSSSEKLSNDSLKHASAVIKCYIRWLPPYPQPKYRKDL
jgi:hypothetical protein